MFHFFRPLIVVILFLTAHETIYGSNHAHALETFRILSSLRTNVIRRKISDSLAIKICSSIFGIALYFVGSLEYYFSAFSYFCCCCCFCYELIKLFEGNSLYFTGCDDFLFTQNKDYWTELIIVLNKIYTFVILADRKHSFWSFRGK